MAARASNRSATVPQARNETVVAAAPNTPMIPTSDNDRFSRST